MEPKQSPRKTTAGLAYLGGFHPSLGERYKPLQVLATSTSGLCFRQQSSVRIRTRSYGLVYIGVYIGIMETKVEATRVYRDSIGYIMV